MKTFSFTVEGSGQFPFDMLRYDRCWPKRESEDVVAMAPDPRGFLIKEQRQVTLTGLQPPTEGRWKSFGWKVLS